MIPYDRILRLLSIGEGDQVIPTPYTYTAIANVIRSIGKEIVFVDVH
jgi:dTDP-4-amino-4,6-dideoxygalactose transaminase